ncbi:recombinase family protein [Tissierella sp. MSJ-40]|uniref:Recombinase family protein n=1 Tax=Tissierella simiarum TaxID=2841534 RepID=A0ABS6ECB0_9FIRM|nr:recombinase family protein [Tissierella simiarum]MBU5439869.1 recombinase family protein [Tissierella simiarum]
MKKITIIPATNSLESNGKLKVAAYCRVSTERESQRSSIDLQIRHYTELIQNNPEWDFVGLFYDYESGLRKDKRNGLDAMLKKAYKGEIDYIITKSISRLSRNVLDILIIIRGLKARGINKQNIWGICQIIHKTMLRNIGICYKMIITMLFISLLFTWGYNMSIVNELLGITKGEIENLNSGEVFLLRDLFKGYEWNRVSHSDRLVLSTLFINYIRTDDRKVYKRFIDQFA